MMSTNLLFPIIQDGEGTPVFLVPSAGATPFTLVQLARSLRLQRPVYSFEFAGMEEGRSVHTSIEEMAAAYLGELRTVQETGPYNIGGHCVGGLVAYDIAAKIEAEGDSVAALILLESFPPFKDKVAKDLDQANERILSSDVLIETEKAYQFATVQIQEQLSRLPPKYAKRFGRFCGEQLAMGKRYRATPIRAPITLLRTSTHLGMVFQDWKAYSAGGFTEQVVTGTSFSMLNPPNVGFLGERLDKVLSTPQSRRH
jgi:thioesterase domain-containing protein